MLSSKVGLAYHEGPIDQCVDIALPEISVLEVEL